MKNYENGPNLFVEENPYPENEPLGVAWAFFCEVNPTPDQLSQFPHILKPENEYILFTLFNLMVNPKTNDEITAEDIESLRRFYERYPHVFEEQKESRERNTDFFDELNPCYEAC